MNWHLCTLIIQSDCCPCGGQLLYEVTAASLRLRSPRKASRASKVSGRTDFTRRGVGLTLSEAGTGSLTKTGPTIGIFYRRVSRVSGFVFMGKSWVNTWSTSLCRRGIPDAKKMTAKSATPPKAPAFTPLSRGGRVSRCAQTSSTQTSSACRRLLVRARATVTASSPPTSPLRPSCN